VAGPLKRVRLLFNLECAEDVEEQNADIVSEEELEDTTLLD
jgi:hypothetical protein